MGTCDGVCCFLGSECWGPSGMGGWFSVGDSLGACGHGKGQSLAVEQIDDGFLLGCITLSPNCWRLFWVLWKSHFLGNIYWLSR